MRVLHVTSHVDTGGIGQYILSLGRALKDRGVTCAVASGGGDLETELERAGVGTRRIDIRTKFEFAPRVFLASRALARIIGEEGFDVVHAHTRVSQVASVLALRRARAHYVSTCHGYFRPRLSRRIFDTWGERVVAISAPVRAHLESDFGVAPSRIALIHNGIDVEKFSKRYTDPEMAQTRTSLGLGAGPVIGTIGRLSPVKGQPFLIEAMKDIIRHVPSAQCLIVGSGNEEASLKRLSVSLGLKDRIIFAGAVRGDTAPYLACMDVFVLPSIKEGLGLALLEAMAAARPCIASDIGGIGDIITDGVDGLLVPVANAHAIAEAAVRLFNDGALRKTLSARAEKNVAKGFSLSSMADRILGLYNEVMREKK